MDRPGRPGDALRFASLRLGCVPPRGSTCAGRLRGTSRPGRRGSPRGPAAVRTPRRRRTWRGRSPRGRASSRRGPCPRRDRTGVARWTRPRASGGPGRPRSRRRRGARGRRGGDGAGRRADRASERGGARRRDARGGLERGDAGRPRHRRRDHRRERCGARSGETRDERADGDGEAGGLDPSPRGSLSAEAPDLAAAGDRARERASSDRGTTTRTMIPDDDRSDQTFTKIFARREMPLASVAYSRRPPPPLVLPHPPSATHPPAPPPPLALFSPPAPAPAARAGRSASRRRRRRSTRPPPTNPPTKNPPPPPQPATRATRTPRSRLRPRSTRTSDASTPRPTPASPPLAVHRRGGSRSADARSGASHSGARRPGGGLSPRGAFPPASRPPLGGGRAEAAPTRSAIRLGVDASRAYATADSVAAANDAARRAEDSAAPAACARRTGPRAEAYYLRSSRRLRAPFRRRAASLSAWTPKPPRETRPPPQHPLRHPSFRSLAPRVRTRRPSHSSPPAVSLAPAC